MKLSIKKQFLLLFLLVIIVSLTLLSFLLRTTVESCFYDYKWSEQSKIFDLIVSRLETYYAEHNSWEGFNGNELAKLAMKEGCYFTLTDNEGNLIWTSEHIIDNQQKVLILQSPIPYFRPSIFGDTIFCNQMLVKCVWIFVWPDSQ